MSRLTLGEPLAHEKNTAILRRSKLRAGRGALRDLTTAIVSAGYYAQKIGKDMVVYEGNSYMHRVYRVSYEPRDYLDPINNTGLRVFVVSPDLTLTERVLVERAERGGP